MVEDVFLARCLFNLLFLLVLSQVHKRVKSGQLVEFESAESLISLHAAQSVLAEGANGNNLALSLNRADNVAKSVLLCKAIASGKSLSVERVIT